MSAAAKRSPKRARRPRQTKAQRIAELEDALAQAQETAAVEQSARVALEQCVGSRLDEIVKLLKGGK